jgi:hypothetical protein
MRLFLASALAACVMACTPTEKAEMTAEGCDVRAASQWTTGSALYSIEASTFGPDCERAVATLVIRDNSGAPAYIEAHIASQVMTLAGVSDVAAMQTALDEWVNTANPQFASSAALPDWPANAESPASGEFPFYVSEGIDRVTYLDTRSRDVPMFCYVQGMESLNCVALDNGGIASLGVQTFPG